MGRVVCIFTDLHNEPCSPVSSTANSVDAENFPRGVTVAPAQDQGNVSRANTTAQEP